MEPELIEDNPMSTGIKNWYSPKELSHDLNVNYMTIIRALNSGQIPGIKIGANWRIYHTVYTELIKQATGFYSGEDL